jgi:NAD(P)-dependent dehydrogenase (short-subunit alcohol dehydrogenase family)
LTWHYEDGLTSTDIADRTRRSRSTVSRILRQAAQFGDVGPLLCVHEFGSRRLDQGHGAIVNIDSTVIVRGSAPAPQYAAGKFGVLGITESYAQAFAPTVRVDTLAYSSWPATRQLGEKDPNTCAYNDLALVRLDPALTAHANPSLPYWGGRAGLDTSGVEAGPRVYSDGNSSLRHGIAALSPQAGQNKADDPSAGRWTHALLSPTPRQQW